MSDVPPVLNAEMLEWLQSPAARQKARALIRRDRLQIDPDEVISRAVITELRRPSSVEFNEGFAGSRLAYAFKALTRSGYRATGPVVPTDFSDTVVADGSTGGVGPTTIEPGVTVRSSLASTRRFLQLALASADRELDIQVIAAAFALVAIAEAGSVPSVVPARSDKLSEREREVIAACWLANPRLRGDGGPDDAATRQARKRFVDRVTDLLRQAAAYGDSEVSVVTDRSEAKNVK